MHEAVLNENEKHFCISFYSFSLKRKLHHSTTAAASEHHLLHYFYGSNS